MPWGVSFQSTTTSFLAIGRAESLNLAAQTIAAAYHTDALLVNPLLIPGSTPLSLPGPSGIQAGFETSFTLAQELKAGPVPSQVWLPAASSIITYWTGAQFNPLIPAPGGLLGTTSSVLFPGDANSLAEGIATAFRAGQPALTQADGASLVAAALNAAFISHLATVSGLWVGTAPGAPPIPYTFPWTGLI